MTKIRYIALIDVDKMFQVHKMERQWHEKMSAKVKDGFLDGTFDNDKYGMALMASVKNKINGLNYEELKEREDTHDGENGKRSQGLEIG